MDRRMSVGGETEKTLLMNTLSGTSNSPNFDHRGGIIKPIPMTTPNLTQMNQIRMSLQTEDSSKMESKRPSAIKFRNVLETPLENEVVDEITRAKEDDAWEGTGET